MKRLPSLEPYFIKAKDIRLSGYSLQRTIRENIHIFSKRLQEGATIKILLVDPDEKKIEKVEIIAQWLHYNQLTS